MLPGHAAAGGLDEAIYPKAHSILPVKFHIRRPYRAGMVESAMPSQDRQVLLAPGVFRHVGIRHLLIWQVRYRPDNLCATLRKSVRSRRLPGCLASCFNDQLSWSLFGGEHHDLFSTVLPSVRAST